MTIRVRHARASDLAVISHVLTRSIIELCAADHCNDPAAIASWTANKSVEGVRAMYANPNLVLLVAGREDRVEAVGAVTRNGTVALNYVVPDARFQGLSRTLLLQLEAELLALGFRNGRLESTATAKRFYEEAGWVADDPQMTERLVNGFPMRKTLGD